MSTWDVDEQRLRMEWLTMQMKKAEFDMEMERRKLTRQTWAIALTSVGVVVAAFAAGAAWMHFLAG